MNWTLLEQEMAPMNWTLLRLGADTGEINNTSGTGTYQHNTSETGNGTSDMIEEENYNFEYKDSNPDEERSELSISANDKMNSIFKNLSSIQMDEEKDEDESKDFLSKTMLRVSLLH